MDFRCIPDVLPAALGDFDGDCLAVGLFAAAEDRPDHPQLEQLTAARNGVVKRRDAPASVVEELKARLKDDRTAWPKDARAVPEPAPARCARPAARLMRRASADR